jgi:hypothetical protein
MPGDLEPSDLAAGAEVMPTTPDGLYRYTAAERRAAAQWLYDTIYNEAFDQAGWFGEILTDAADDIASQICNTFANDDAEGKDSNAWQTLADANAVSPDNILLWDSPANGGLYGFVEPLIYREPRVEKNTVSRWKKAVTRGTLSGTVTVEGANTGLEGAAVQVYEGKSMFSQPFTGRYELSGVPLGAYLLKGWKVINGAYFSAEKPIVLASEKLTADLELKPPEDRFRLAQIFIDFNGRDDEDWPSSDEKTDPGPEYYELELGPDRLTHQMSRTYRWGGEVRAEFTIKLTRLADHSVLVEVYAVLYEGTSESTDDFDGKSVISFLVPKEQTAAGVIRVSNTDEDEPDTFGQLAITVTNVRNNN